MRFVPAIGRSTSGETHYCASLGLPSFRETLAENYGKEFGVPIIAANVVVVPGGKIFEQFFCESVLDAGDSVLVFSPQFPTFVPNIERRGAKPVFSRCEQRNSSGPT